MSTKPLTITEVDQWPPLGPMNLDPQRVRDVLLELEGQRERAERAEAQLASVSGVTRLELVAAARAEAKADAIAIVERHIYEEDTELASVLASLKAMAVTP